MGIQFLDVLKRPGRRNFLDVSATDPLPVSIVGTGGSAAGLQTALAPVTITPSTTNQQVAAANPARRYAVISNDSSVKVYLRFGSAAATISAFAIALAPGASYELPSGVNTAVQLIAAAAGSGLVGFQELQA